MVDFYNLLGLPPDAPQTEIRRAFRARAKQVHPDAHPHLDAAQREGQHRRFIQLAQAYDTLSDPGRRAAYDRRWRVRFAGAAGAGGQPRRTGTTARPRAGAGRRAGSTGTRAGGPKPDGPPTGPGPTPDLDELLRDVENLLGRFGLDLRQPAERLLDALLDWAREIFRQVSEALNPAADPAGGANRGGGRGGSARPSGEADAEPPPHGHAGGPTPDAGASRFHRPRPGDEADIEHELRELKRRAGRRDGRGHVDGPAEIEAELRRLKRRRGR